MAVHCIAFVTTAQYISTKLYTINDGLPDNYIYSVYEDSFGYLWVSSNNGVSRFDGRNFKNYSLAAGLPSLTGGCIFEDSYHRLWVGTRAGVARLIGNKFVCYPIHDSLEYPYVFSMSETKGRKIWAATNKGVYQFNDSVWEKLRLVPGYENELCRGVIHTDSAIYLNYGKFLAYLDSKRSWHKLNEGNYPVDYFNQLFVSKGELFVTTNGAIFRIRDNQLVTVVNKFRGDINFISLIDSHNRLWYCYAEGDNFFHLSAPGNYSQFTQRIFDTHKLVSGLFEDSHGNIWAATFEGLLKIRINNVIPFHQLDTLQTGKHLSVAPVQESGLFIFSDKGYAFCGSDRPIRKSDFTRIDVDGIHRFTIDGRHQTWFTSGRRRLYKIRGRKLYDFSFLLHLRTNAKLNSCTYDVHRERLFICGDSTLLEGNENKIQEFRPANMVGSIPYCTSVLATRNGGLLLIVPSLGLCGIDARNHFFVLSKARPGLSNFGSLYEAPDGTIWVADPSVGLSQYRFNESGSLQWITNISERDGLQNNLIYSVAFDSLQRVWIATSVGLDILQKNNRGQWEVFNYSKETGLQLYLNYYSSLVGDAAGNMWFSSWEGLVKFDARHIELVKNRPGLMIERVEVNLGDINWNKCTDSFYSYLQLPVRPRLNYDQRTLTIYFNGISFSSAPMLRYSYRLSPLETNWSSQTTNRSVSFVKLPPGKYKFMVRARDGTSEWSTVRELEFSIAAPFWMKGWFIVLCFSVAAGLIYIAFRYRLNQVKKILTLRSKISRDLHDEIGSTLTSINILSKVSHDNLEKDNKKVAGMLEKITEQSQDIQQSVSDIVWAIRPDNDKLENLVARMREYIGRTAEAKNMVVNFYADEQNSQSSLSMQRRHNVFLIFKEAINNAVKYSDAKEITVFLKPEKGNVKLLIQDDGIGFDPNAIRSSSGLKNMKARAHELGARLQIYSSKNNGTKIELDCPTT